MKRWSLPAPLAGLIALLALVTLACGVVDDLFEPQSTIPVPPTLSGQPPTPPLTPPPGGLIATPTLAPVATETTPPGQPMGQPPEDPAALAAWMAAAYADGRSRDEVCAALEAAGWRQADAGCDEADLDGDGRAEWLLTLDYTMLQPDPGVPLQQGYPGDFWIVHENGVVYQAQDPARLDFFGSAPALLELVDMTGDGRPEAVTVFETCGAHTCFKNYQVVGAEGGTIRNLVPAAEGTEGPAVISLSYVDEERLADETGDGLPDLVISGGLVGSAGAGIQRARTEVWSWDGAAITLLEQRWQDTGIRFHTLYNANYAFEQEDYAVARGLYEAVIVDPALEDVEWATGNADEVRSSVQQFAGFRLALLPLFQGDITEATRWQNWLEDNYGGAPITEAAGLLIETWQNNGNDLAAACAAVTSYLEGAATPTGPLRDMGYNNPALEAADVCPLG